MVAMTRNEAVAAIRKRLLEFVDDDYSMCQVAGDRGIMCHGFRQLTDDELRRRYSWLVRTDPTMSRAKLEHLANTWQLARQIVRRVPISCDAQALEKDTCKGWCDFDDATIARFYEELIGEDITIEVPQTGTDV